MDAPLVYDGAGCEPCTPLLHLSALLFIGTLPCGCCWAFSQNWRSCAVMAAICALPRVLWSSAKGSVAEGPRFWFATALHWNLVYSVAFASPLLLSLCCWKTPRVWMPAVAAYAFWTRLVSRPELRDSRPWPSFAQQEWGFHAFRRFLRIRLHMNKALHDRPVERPVVLALHPHGIASDFRPLIDGLLYEALPGREMLCLSASVLFCIPVVRELALWTRCIDARKSVAAGALKRGRSLLVIPGGEVEQIQTVKGHEQVVLARRMGFVKLALETGAALVPSYVFGCVDLYDTYSALYAPREWLRKKFGICIPLYRGSIGFLAKRVPLNIVVGDPLEFSCAEPGKPSDSEVTAAHAAYVAALRELFDAHKARFGYADRQLDVS